MKSLIIFLFPLFIGVSQVQAELLPISGFDLTTGSESSVSIKDKKALVVVFLSATCPCSNSHITEIDQLAQLYKEFQFVGVHSNANEDKTFSMNYFKKINLPFPVIQDDQFKIADRFKANKTPHSFIVNKEGQYLFQGGVTDSNKIENSSRKYLREALEDLSSNRPTRTASVRTLGCAIDRGVKNVW